MARHDGTVYGEINDLADAFGCSRVSQKDMDDALDKLNRALSPDKYKPIERKPNTILILSWNIDGVKAHFDALKQLACKYQPDIICLQKFKCSASPKPFELSGYRMTVSPGPWAGVATYVRGGLKIASELTFDEEPYKGHVIRTEIEHPHFSLFNTYVPYANTQVDGYEDRRRHFNYAICKFVSDTADRIVMCGDFNIVHGPLDTWDGRYISNNANYRQWERDDFNLLLQAGSLVDTFRQLHPESPAQTYFVQNKQEYRKKQMGVRLDYFLASKSLVPYISKADILSEPTVSPSNPIILEFRY